MDKPALGHDGTSALRTASLVGDLAMQRFSQADAQTITIPREPTQAMIEAGYDNGYGVIIKLEPDAARSFWARAVAASGDGGTSS